MSDKDTFIALVKKCGGSAQTTQPAKHLQCKPNTASIVWASAGYRSHVEAEFDAEGNILSLGSFWDDNEMPDEKS